MLQFEELRLELASYEDKLVDLADALGLQKMKTEVEELEAETAKDGFIAAPERSQRDHITLTLFDALQTAR